MKITLDYKDTDGVVKFVTAKKWAKMPETKRLGEGTTFFTLFDNTVVLDKGNKTEDDYRTLGFKLVGYLDSLADKTFTISAPPVHLGPFIEGLVLGNYDYQYYKSKPKKSSVKMIAINNYLSADVDTKTAQAIVDKAIARAKAQCLTRDMVNGSPDDMNSETILAKIRGTFGHNSNVKVSWFSEGDLQYRGMQGHLAVNRASRHPAMTIKLEYEPDNWKKHIVLVGKGLTYDSGGLDIKTSGHMQTMKTDKGGAMTVFGIMKGLDEIGSKHKVTAYLGMAENMIDGSAYKADDVLTMKNGTTVHVKNTDAEGRIVLFDNLCLAEEENPDLDEIYTFATLTGAAVFQFGDEACGMVGFNDKLKKKVKKVGDVEGEVFCNAEFHKFMMDGVKDSVADISNTGTNNQGCQKAGLFLTYALTKKGKKKYLHLDIAGPAYVSKAFGTNKTGATGFGVRTFLNYLSR